MRISTSSLLFLIGAAVSANAAFVPRLSTCPRSTNVAVKGYLDKLEDLSPPPPEEEVEDDSPEANKMSKEELDRFGPGNWQQFVDFEEFDGGDGQMGVAGDGEKGLDKKEFNQPMMGKSKFRSAKNAWGTFSGYAEELVEKGVEKSRAQQLENWHNQQEVYKKGRTVKDMADKFDAVTYTEDENWRALAKFGVERVDDFDLDKTFGEVKPGDEIEGTIELKSVIGRPVIHEFSLKNPYMGFADFRARFTTETSSDWTVAPNEGALQREPVNFIVRFKPQNPGVSEGYLIIETEDMKKTWKVVGSTA